ncbi:glycerate kinase [Thiothrix eikelboomii]|uniref:Glycerate kinase n=1 Tax=Thiothrix eikelboomii TaxID=92487 RepID=A0A1T4WZW4_9GAMM|nr:glycerate kinase [Thiothrix eikelboomii]SKA82856.1 glycerate kinase [Thiothrix eikelboomii]
MKILLAPDSFKESLSAAKAAAAMARGVRQVLPQAELLLLPVADGGEGTAEALVSATQGQFMFHTVTDPLGREITAHWGLLNNAREPVAVIEVAAASGLERLAVEERNPCITSTHGTGELIMAALDQGVRRFIIGLGGSATNDAGAGMLQALGVRLLDANGQTIPPGGLGLQSLRYIDVSTLDPRLAHCVFEVACDVDNPLTGARGAAAVFAPQKGANDAMVRELDAALLHFAHLVQSLTGRDVGSLQGAGAAGGLGAAFMAFLPAQLKSGVDIVLDACGFDEHVRDADLVITGEGKIDGQTAHGKTPIGVARRAKQHGVPVIALAGSITAGAEAVYDQGIDAVFSIVPGVVTLPDALRDAEANLERTSIGLARVIKISQ